MQTLGLAESTPRTESRLKSLFWPSVQTPEDVDYLGTQGFWVSLFIGIFNLVFATIMGAWLPGLTLCLVYVIGAIGVRERSRYAAIVMFLLYAIDTIFVGFSLVRLILNGLFLANVRATWIAATWEGAPDVPPAPRLNETLMDKISDQMPPRVWPHLRYFYYLLSGSVLIFYIYVMIVVLNRHR